VFRLVSLRSRIGVKRVRCSASQNKKVSKTQLLVNLKLSQLTFQIVTLIRYLYAGPVGVRNLRLRPFGAICKLDETNVAGTGDGKRNMAGW
jgi:hypothetical protein